MRVVTRRRACRAARSVGGCSRRVAEGITGAVKTGATACIHAARYGRVPRALRVRILLARLQRRVAIGAPSDARSSVRIWHAHGAVLTSDHVVNSAALTVANTRGGIPLAIRVTNARRAGGSAELAAHLARDAVGQQLAFSLKGAQRLRYNVARCNVYRSTSGGACGRARIPHASCIGNTAVFSVVKQRAVSQAR